MKPPKSRNARGGAKKPFDPSRRDFLLGMAATTGALTLGGCGGGSDGEFLLPGLATGASRLPAPEDSGIDHIVQVMMENRSFDHFLGWVPGADGRQAGLLYPDANGKLVETFHLASNPDYGYQGCGWGDPNHNYEGGRVHMANGAMNAWLQTSPTTDKPDDKFPVGYYTAEDLQFYKGVAQNFTVCDRYFHGILASTFPNRIYIHAGATDRLDNSLPDPNASPPAPSSLHTIWDELKAKGISGKNYFHDLPITALWLGKHEDITAPFEQFLVDAASGNLPAVSYFDPNFGFSVGETPAGVSRDDHPQADVRDGQVYLTHIYNALRASPNWERTLMIVTYDEWGGFYDHVVPPFAPVSAAEAALGNDGRLGFRTPCVIVGPRARRGHVSHLQFDPNSVINLIRWRFGLGRVGDSPRNDTSLNMAHALDFTNPPNTDAPAFGDLGPGGLGESRAIPYGSLCTQAAGLPGLPNPLAGSSTSQRDAHLAEFIPLYEMAKSAGMI